MENYCSSVNNGIQNLKKFGALDFEVLHRVILFMGMAEVPKYESLITVLMNNDKSTVDDITAAYLDKAASLRKEKGPSERSDQAFSTQSEKGKASKKDLSKIKCYVCEKTGHMAKDCRSKGKSKADSGKPKKGDKGASSRASGGASETEDDANFTFVVSGRKMDKDWWIDDSGSSEMFTNRREVFQTFKPIEERVQVGNMEYLPVESDWSNLSRCVATDQPK